REPLLRAAARTSVGALGADVIERAHRRTLKQGKRVGRDPRAEDLHELRIRAKRLRYVLEVVDELAGREGRRLLDDLADLQDVLGAHQDAVVGGQVLRRFIEAAPPLAASARAGAIAEALATEMARAAEARARFAKAWSRFTSKRTDRHVDAVLERLRASARAR
ncbi:MAG: CHAD domain-containing protein, partial [bacterium]